MNTDEKLQAALNAHTSGRIEEADRLYWDVLKERPNDALALHHIGVIRFNHGDLSAAAELINKSISIAPTSEAHNNLGLIFAAQRKMNEALNAYRQSIALNPQNPETYNNLAIAHLEQSNVDEAIEACRKATILKPDYFLAFYNLGVGLQQKNKPKEASEAFKKAVEIQPAFPEAYCNLGLAYMAMGQKEEAVTAYQKAIALRPEFPEALNNLGQPLNELGRLEEAAEVYKKASALRPAYTDAFVNLAHTLRKLGHLNEAIEACRAGLASNPTYPKAQIELISLRRQTCDWSNADADMRQLFALIQDVEPFLLLSAPSSVAEQSFCAKRWSARAPKGIPFVNDRSRPSDRIRIGYLSSDYHMHATAFLMAELFERHDRSKFEIFAYSYDVDDGSDIRKRLIKGFDHFIDINATSNGEAAQRIHDDKIDILIDLKGYTNGTRTEILADHPAPVQVNYVGYPGTLGADFIDYVIGDRFVTPAEHQPFYTEKIIQLPHCYQPNDTKREISSRLQSRKENGLPENGFVFCCFNASFKLTPTFFDLWMRLLKAVPNSVLWLIAMNPAVEANLRREAKARGIDAARLVFARPLMLPEHLARHRLADLFLDALPYGAHTTASDALWAGLPVLTCMGDTFAGRVGTSALHAVGMPELITKSIDEYEARALELAAHPEKLLALRQKLAQNLPTAPLFDSEKYTRALESAFTRIYKTWRDGQPAQGFLVDD